jgi:hypothetical protein
MKWHPSLNILAAGSVNVGTNIFFYGEDVSAHASSNESSRWHSFSIRVNMMKPLVYNTRAMPIAWHGILWRKPWRLAFQVGKRRQSIRSRKTQSKVALFRWWVNDMEWVQPSVRKCDRPQELYCIVDVQHRWYTIAVGWSSNLFDIRVPWIHLLLGWSDHHLESRFSRSSLSTKCTFTSERDRRISHACD